MKPMHSMTENSATMKIAIPTDDGLHISRKCENAKGFFIATLNNNRIVGEEMRWNAIPTDDDPRTKPLSNIEDCKVVIAAETWENCAGVHPHYGFEVVVAQETIITNVMMEFVNNQARTEANTCCCP